MVHIVRRTMRSCHWGSRPRQLVLIGLVVLLGCFVAAAVSPPFMTTAAPLADATETPTGTVVSTATATPGNTTATATATPGNTTATATATPGNTTATATATPSDAATPTATAASTQTPTSTQSAPTATPATTSTPTSSPQPTATQSPQPTATRSPQPTATQPPQPTSIPTQPPVASRRLYFPIIHQSQAATPGAVSSGAVFISDARINTLRDRVARKTEPNYTAWKRVQRICDEQLDRQPHAPSRWFVPFYYRDTNGHLAAKQGLQDDSNFAYQLALCYRITGDEKYAATAARIVNAWGTKVNTLSTEQDSRLSFSYHFPAIIFAADLLKRSPSFPASQQQAFKAFVRNKALPMASVDRDNNQGNWGLVLVAASGAYLGDKALLQQSADRWKEFIETQIGSDGRMLEEVTRNNNGDRGIYYSHFSLFPQTIAAEILRLNGIDVFNYTSRNGHSLRQAYECVAKWSRNPDNFPVGSYYRSHSSDDYEWQIKIALGYFEILNERWPNSNAQTVLEARRPLVQIHSAPAMSFTHGDLLAP